MSGRQISNKGQNIYQYLTRSEASRQEQEKISNAESAEQKERENMADGNDKSAPTTASTTKPTDDEVSNTELRNILVGLDRKLEKGVAEIKESVDKLTDRVDSVEIEVASVKKVQAENMEEMDNLKQELHTVRDQLLHLQVHNRKYNLLIYGLEGHEKEVKDAIERVRKFGRDDLLLGDLANTTTIRTAHRLQERENGPSPIIVKFMFWLEREEWLKAGRNLRGKKFSIRTDLPPVLKAKRGALAARRFEIRRDEPELKTRIREKGVEVFLEMKRDTDVRWSRIA